MNIRKLSLLLWAALLIVACSTPKNEKETTDENNSSTVNFTVLQLNDVYEMSPVSGGKLGGLARVQTLLNELKAENEHTYTVLSGDMLSPSAIGTAKSNGKKIAGEQMVDILNKMNWDYFILGNHEFDLSEDDLKARLNEMKFTVISDNVSYTENEPFPKTIRNTQFEVEGVKVGLLGITLNNYRPKYGNIADPIESAKKAVEELQEKKSDVIIALTHQAITDDIKMAGKISNIDIIMGGHEHEHYDTTHKEIPIRKADANAKSVFVHRFSYHTSTKELNINSELVVIDSTFEKDPTIKAIAQRWTDTAFASFERDGRNPKKVVCYSTKKLDGTEISVRSKSTELTRLLTRGFINAFGDKAEASIMNGGTVRIDDILQIGSITEYDILKISPFGDSISLVEIIGDSLIAALEVGSKSTGSGSFLHYSNIKKEGETWTLKGSPIKSNQFYTIAISSYLVKRGDKGLGMLKFKKGIVKETTSKDLDFIDVTINQFEREFPLKK